MAEWKMNARRWGDNDYYIGPITFSFRERWRHFAVLLSSGSENYPGCNLRVSAFGNTMIVSLPQIIRYHKSWVDMSGYEWAKERSDGRKGYVQLDEREYGFMLSDGHLSVKFGRQTHDSDTTQDWGWFLPWRSWRHVRHSFYGLDGAHFATLPDTGKSYIADPGRWEREDAIKKSVPTIIFDFDDFDGERISATTRIEEREWRLGEGKFKWLSIFRKPRVQRYLDIQFSSETGKRKRSWKGGTVGHSIEMRIGELHDPAFRRYCAENNMTFVGEVKSPEKLGDDK